MGNCAGIKGGDKDDLEIKIDMESKTKTDAS